ncbi:MAG: type I 3-dehydroquinate dehydratase [Deltaproteobacteria bacterium RIFCSPLOWO2_02_FULL_53_8]|nr:MAG: type I 3-dehydroquinate dehydratase [Deltaproteobacteria bacterium RIFCSPLOWO2_02_FULL_53_8]
MKRLTKKRGQDIDLFLHNAPRIAGVIAGGLSVASVKKAARLGADLIEVRVDALVNRDPARLIERFKEIKADAVASRVPILLTVRSVKEGGRLPLTDGERLALFTTLMPFADLVDIELSSHRLLKDVLKSAKKSGTRLIVSYHNFVSTPGHAALSRIIKKGREAGAQYVKIAAVANDRATLKRLAGLLTTEDRLIVIAMGDYGRPSRIFFPLLGSALTYGSIADSTAPGQMTVDEIKKSWKLIGL